MLEIDIVPKLAEKHVIVWRMVHTSSYHLIILATQLTAGDDTGHKFRQRYRIIWFLLLLVVNWFSSFSGWSFGLIVQAD